MSDQVNFNFKPQEDKENVQSNNFDLSMQNQDSWVSKG